MAATSNFQEKVTKMFECSICLERLNDPKVLHCTHSYCKTCLDKILEFKSDGSALIACPLRCEGHTEIPVDKTTNDLKVPVQLRNLMEMMAEEVATCDVSLRKYKCDGISLCKRDLSFYCAFCFAKLCTTCKNNHNHKHGTVKYIPIKSEVIDYNDLLPWCDEHATFATYACQEGFICIYCKERTHTNHRLDKLEVLSQQVITWVNEQKANVTDLEKLHQDIKCITESEIKVIRSRLLATLRNRKINCLSSYLNWLNEEEERLVSHFDATTLLHCNAYPSPKPAYYISNIPKFQVFLNRDSIFKNVRNLVSGELSIPQINITLSEENSYSEHPLGEILEEYTTILKLRSGKAGSTVSSSVPDSEIKSDVEATLIKELNHLLQQAIGEERNAVAINKEDIEDTLPDAIEEETDEVAINNEDIEDILPGDISSADKKELMKKLSFLSSGGKDKRDIYYLWGYCMFNEDLLIEVINGKREILSDKWNENETGESVLHFAATKGLRKLIEFILSKDLLPVDVMDTKGRMLTPLHNAVINNHPECVQVLLEYNANTQIKNANGKTALDCARNSKDEEIIKLLPFFV